MNAGTAPQARVVGTSIRRSSSNGRRMPASIGANCPTTATLQLPKPPAAGATGGEGYQEVRDGGNPHSAVLEDVEAPAGGRAASPRSITMSGVSGSPARGGSNMWWQASPVQRSKEDDELLAALQSSWSQRNPGLLGPSSWDDRVYTADDALRAAKFLVAERRVSGIHDDPFESSPSSRCGAWCRGQRRSSCNRWLLMSLAGLVALATLVCAVSFASSVGAATGGIRADRETGALKVPGSGSTSSFAKTGQLTTQVLLQDFGTVPAERFTQLTDIVLYPKGQMQIFKVGSLMRHSAYHYEIFFLRPGHYLEMIAGYTMLHGVDVLGNSTEVKIKLDDRFPHAGVFTIGGQTAASSGW